MKQNRYSILAHELKEFHGYVVGVLWDPVFSGLETPTDLRFVHFVETWGSLPHVKVVALDANQIRSYEILFRGKMDILVFPYGSVYPMDAMGMYSGQTLGNFLKRGGAILTTGGIPFMKQAAPDGEIVSLQTPDEMTSVFDKWISKFGIKYYETPILPDHQLTNTEFLPSLPEIVPLAPNRYGIIANNSSHDPVPKPPHGNVFPERYPARQVIPLMCGTDRFGEIISTSAILVQDFETGSRQIFFTHEENPHPLSPSSIHFSALMRDMFALLTNKLMVSDIEAEYACYRQNEKVCIHTDVINHESVPAESDLRLIIKAKEKVQFMADTNVLLQNGTTSTEWEWTPARFEDDEYTAQLQLVRNGRVVSTAKNGFVVWDESSYQNGSDFGIKKQYFSINDKGSFITGTNYYESSRGEIMWFRPNIANIIRDYRQMYNCGVNLIRPHFHHLKWFKDYLLYHHGKLFPFYEQLNNLTDPLPDEHVWRIWDLFIYLGHKYGLIFNGDLFTLVPEEMGDPRGWFGTVETICDKEKRSVQKEFLQALESRYQNVPGITWDLFNEPYQIAVEDVVDWVAELKSTLTEINSTRLVTVGGQEQLGMVVAYDSLHGRLSGDFFNQGDRPILLQELHIDHPETLYDERQQAEDLRYFMLLAIRNGIAGVCPWSWTRQMRLWQDSYEHHYTFPMEKWDDRLGMHTHDDGTPKIAGQVFKDMAFLLQHIDFLYYDKDKKLSVTSIGTLSSILKTGGDGVGHRLVHFNGELCFSGMAFEKFVWQGHVFVEGPPSGYVFFICLEADFVSSKQIYIKTEAPGFLIISRPGVVGIDLVDGPASNIRKLASVPWSTENNQTRISVDPEMTHYWLKLYF